MTHWWQLVLWLLASQIVWSFGGGFFGVLLDFRRCTLCRRRKRRTSHVAMTLAYRTAKASIDWTACPACSGERVAEALRSLGDNLIATQPGGDAA